jgi:hypothetical protein
MCSSLDLIEGRLRVNHDRSDARAGLAMSAIPRIAPPRRLAGPFVTAWLNPKIPNPKPAARPAGAADFRGHHTIARSRRRMGHGGKADPGQ